MKFKTVTLLATSALMLGACGGKGGNTASGVELADRMDTLAWAYGSNLAKSFSQGILDSLDKELIVAAIQHTLEGKPQPLDEQEAADAMSYLLFLHNSSQMRQANQLSSQVSAQQEQYLDNLKRSNPAVKEHPSGFCYEVVREGHGPNAKLAQRICFDYRSKLMLTGEDYDQSYGRRDSIVHVVGKPMFAGLIDAFQLMNEGSLYRFYFPYQLAFGESGSGNIPGYTPFIYEVELHKVFKN